MGCSWGGEKLHDRSSLRFPPCSTDEAPSSLRNLLLLLPRSVKGFEPSAAPRALFFPEFLICYQLVPERRKGERRGQVRQQLRCACRWCHTHTDRAALRCCKKRPERLLMNASSFWYEAERFFHLGLFITLGANRSDEPEKFSTASSRPSPIACRPAVIHIRLFLVFFSRRRRPLLTGRERERERRRALDV